ncbi:M20/M25/M40 family metallo-hydrolase [bacterium]|nr:M20/M25/M40 family metallo-hydrolase [bacterium]
MVGVRSRFGTPLSNPRDMHSSILGRLARLMLASALLPAALLAQGKELPLKYVGPASKPEITAGDLMTRLYKFADDSMMGRQVGTEWNIKGTAYIEAEVRKMGLKPAGDNGTYFQNLPLYLRALDTSSTLVVDGKTFKAGTDFMAGSVGRKVTQFTNTAVVYVGMQFDTANVPTADMVKGKVVMLRGFQPGPGFNQAALMASPSFKAWQAVLPQAAATITVGAAAIPPQTVAAALNPTRPSFLGDAEAAVRIQLTQKVAEAMLGGPLADAKVGTVGKPITTNVRFIDTFKELGRNVVAILPGTDPKLKGQYVAVGAHNDHVGFRASRPADHDSVKAFMQIVRPQGADNAPTPATPEQTAQVKALTDSLHKLHGGARADSIFNGADDDGSGSVSVMEIAEAFAKTGVKPKRSIIFVWHAGEEAGLWGSQYFTDNPTVPRDSIVAQLNMDMVGRGRATDATGEAKDGSLLHGGPGYLQLVGSRRLSTELGDLVEAVNKAEKLNFVFDYNIDADGHPQNIYCRSDHYEYARYGIPVVFMTTGGHADYHQVTDEPQYIDYDHMADVSRLVMASAMKIANLDHRIVVDKPKPNPKGACVQ